MVGALAALPLLQPEAGEAGKKKRGKKGKKGNGKKKPKTPPPNTTTPRPCAVRHTDNLQAAIDAATPGSTLALCAGTWNINATVRIEKSITLIGAGIDQTILDGGDKVRVVFISQNSTVTLQDLTVTRANTAPRVGETDVFGGGIKTYKADVTLRNVAVTNNASGYGGGIFHQAGTLVLAAGTRVANNQAVYSTAGSGERGGSGGGIFVLESGAVTLEPGSSVTNNTAAFPAGGISSSGPLTLQPGSTVSSNTPDNCSPDNGTCI